MNQWLIANKISLNATKTELIYFRNKRTPKPITKIKLNGITLEETTHAKYVGLVLDEYLDFKRHITLLNAKLKRANNLIAISRHYVTKDLLMQIYYRQFYSHINYGCQLWGQNENAVEQTVTLQKKAIRLLSFAHYQEESSPLFKNLNLLKLSDIVKQNNIIFTHNSINSNTPRIFNDYFIFEESKHQYQTVNSLNSTYSIPAGSSGFYPSTFPKGRFSLKIEFFLSYFIPVLLTFYTCLP